MRRPYRFAFLVPTFVTEPDAGGLASYAHRMTRALLEAGHQPEVFVLSEQAPAIFDHEGVRVMRVPRGLPRLTRPMTRLWLLRGLRAPVELLAGARRLADALEHRHRQAPFDVVQSSDYRITGWYVRACAGRRHLVRCSTAGRLLARVDQGNSPWARRWWNRLELAQVRRAEIAYAPSRFVAEYYAHALGRPIAVVRPPAQRDLDPHPAAVLPDGLPPRFLLHFGQLRASKGTCWLLDALLHAWAEAPDLHLVLAGSIGDSRLRRRLGAMNDRRLLVLGAQPRLQMDAVLRRATAAVLPSLVDNLPNSVIESLGLGIPVIGTRGASIDELVEDGRHGQLVAPDDVAGLAGAMVRAWRGASSVRPGFTWDSPLAALMSPRAAVAALGRLAGLELVDHQVETVEPSDAAPVSAAPALAAARA